MKLIKTVKRYEMRGTSYHTKDVPKSAGFWWDPDAKVWWTNVLERAHVLREYASRELKDEIEREYTNLKNDLKASSAVDADINIPKPREEMKYLPFQKAGVKFVQEKMKDHNGVMIADEMGLGKTIQAIGMINAEKYQKVLVVCPASLKLNWKKEMQKWIVGFPNIGVAKGSVFPDEDMVIINYDILKKNIDNIMKKSWDIVIVDEAHYAKNPKAQRTKALRQICSENRMLLLTGTPIVNRPQEAYEMLRTMNPQKYTGGRDRYRFYYRYCHVNKTRWGTDFYGGKNLDVLQKELRRHMVRRLKKDVLKDLPPKTRQVIVLDQNTSKEIREVTKEMKEIENSNPDYEDAIKELSFPKALFEEMAKIRHQVGKAKAPEVIKFVDNILDINGKVVVFAHHKDVVDKFMDHWGKKAVKVVGGMSSEEKEEAVKQFQENDDIRVFIGNIQAAGVGLTLTASSTVVFAELAWRPSDIQQAEDRLHRIGQNDNVLVYHLVVDDTLDARIANTIIEKQRIIDESTNTEIEENGSSKIINDLESEEEEKKKALEEAKKIAEKKVNDVSNNKRKKVIDQANKRNVKCEYSEEKEKALVEAIKIVASDDQDRAKVRNNMGFNKRDTGFGCSLASQDSLSPAQYVCAYRMMKKYKRQYPTDIYNTIYA